MRILLGLYFSLCLLVLSGSLRAQSTVTGLGNHRIGQTTVDSLNQTTFTEQETYVKGTIALTCPHIRTFMADTVMIASKTATTVILTFYDNVLFNISCDFSDALKTDFMAQYGPGVPQPLRNLTLCKEQSTKPLSIWSNTWPGDGIRAVAIYRKGYTAECKATERATLIIYDQTIWALSSECDLPCADPLLAEFDKTDRNE